MKLSATSYDSGAGIEIRVQNNGDRRIAGFTVKVRLEDNVREHSMLEPMEVISVKMDGRELEERANWVLKDVVATRHAGALLIWTDLEPGQEAVLEVTTSATPIEIREQNALIQAACMVFMLLFFVVGPGRTVRQEAWRRC